MFLLFLFYRIEKWANASQLEPVKKGAMQKCTPRLLPHDVGLCLAVLR